MFTFKKLFVPWKTFVPYLGKVLFRKISHPSVRIPVSAFAYLILWLRAYCLSDQLGRSEWRGGDDLLDAANPPAPDLQGGGGGRGRGRGQELLHLQRFLSKVSGVIV